MKVTIEKVCSPVFHFNSLNYGDVYLTDVDTVCMKILLDKGDNYVTGAVNLETGEAFIVDKECVTEVKKPTASELYLEIEEY